MYLLSFLIVVIISIATIGLLSLGVVGDFSGAYLFMDTWSFIILIILCVPVLISSGLFKDFNNAFRLAVKIKTKTGAGEKENTEKGSEREVTLSEVKCAIEAVILVRKVLLAGGAFIVLLTLAFVLAYLNSNDALGVNSAVALLPLVYAFAADIFLLPVEARLKVRLNDIIHQ